MKGTFLVFLHLLCLSYCWWQTGHMLTAQIAWNHMQVQGRSDVQQWAENLSLALNPLTNGKSNTFVESAVWADDIREEATDFMDLWHFTNKPINDDGIFFIQNPIRSTYNSLTGLQRIHSILTNPLNIHQDINSIKSSMLRYLIHVIGDIHQPLHDTNFYNGTYNTTSGDLGGNFQIIKRQDGSSINLHAFWDAGAFILQPSDDFLVRPLNQSAQWFLKDWGFKLMSKHKLSRFQQDKIDMTNPEIWIQDGYNQAQQHIYKYFRFRNQVTKDYAEQAYQIIERNIALAGYRLGYKLIEIHDIIQQLKKNITTV